MAGKEAKETDPLLPNQVFTSNPLSKGDRHLTIGKKGTVKTWFTSTNFLLYCSHFLSAWGDRMWQFATGMFLVTLNPNSLQLTAIYGFTSGGSILFMGAIVGHWVDKYKRLNVARTALVVQNVSVAISAMAVCLTLYFDEEIKGTWNGALETICHVVIIIFAVLADIASMGRTISIERDWIVVICGDEARLTNMSAFLRRIDLTTKLLAPVVTGQVITYGSSIIGAIFIAAWNLVSVCVEYVLLHKVYHSCPELALKQDQLTGGVPNPNLVHNSNSFVSKSGFHEIEAQATFKTPEEAPQKSPQRSGIRRVCTLFLDSFITLFVGWKLYAKQSILLACLALAFLYMTVLGFDNITSGFAKEQGLSESVIGILMAAGACIGISGTLVFPHLREKLGLTRTGLLSLFLQNSCLAMCVVSVWLPGSPFDPGFLANPEDPCPTVPSLQREGSVSSVAGMNSDDFTWSFGAPMIYPGGYSVSAVSNFNCTSPAASETSNTPTTSVIVLMAGIVFARFGLWMADLTVTQLLLETPPAGERGKVNGVQSSLNQMMDMIKFLLVIFLPWPQTFGLLILISYTFVSGGLILFSAYACKTRRQKLSVQPQNNTQNVKA